jgi:dTDP-4-dehydrorhamnose 3,5-epimerase
MPISCKPLGLNGLVLIQPTAFGDERGYFLESFNDGELARAGIPARFVRDCESRSTKGVLRGLHFQKTHPEGKLVRVTSGEVFDVAVDLRHSSPTFGKWEAIRLSGELMNQLYLPAGFAHGFLVLSEEALLAYKCTDYYAPDDEGGIRWDDASLSIDWPDAGVPPRLSAKDRNLPAFDSKRRYF